MTPVDARTARANFVKIKNGTRAYTKVRVAIAAPYVYLADLAKVQTKACALCAQDVSVYKEGAHTGDVSAAMLAASKVRYVIIGHSERRALGETNAVVRQKVELAQKAGLTPIVCVGETDREQGMWYLGTVKTQIEECFGGLSRKDMQSVVIAYEPVWAISTTPGRKDATPEDCREMILYIRKVLADMFGAEVAQNVRVLYGGSVDEKNAASFLSAGAEGLLPGRASQKPETFIKIIKIANEIR